MGVGVIESNGNSYRLIYYDVLKLSSKTPLCDRLGKIYKFIKKTISDYDVEAVSIEDVFTSINPRSALKLGQGKGAAVAAAIEAGVKVFEYSPREIKKAISCYGAADKSQVAKMVGILLGVKDITPFDATDALATSICHINTVPIRKNMEGLNDRKT
jgi:crossover junction endodeoxyribonuclease RuvC